MDWDIVIGLEVHVQLNTKTKAFCACKVSYGDPPNTHVCPVCLGYPGSLPVLNRAVVDSAIKLGLATHCRIREYNTFARKNYFYPDLPKGYQISQYKDPICYEGYVDIAVRGEQKRIGLTRIHIEEDAGKSMHGEDGTLVDLNRCGTPLLEIVSEPDIHAPEEAYTYLNTLKQIVRYTGISDCNMEEGSMRCDANISIKPKGRKALGTRTELKNMNSFRNVERALKYEAERQRKVLESGAAVTQQTLLWDEQSNQTKAMRSKEDSHDYRYFPEPDLSPLRIDDAWIGRIRSSLPELPDARKKRFTELYGLTEEDAALLSSEKEIADYFENSLQTFNNPRLTGNWVKNEILRILSESGKSAAESPVTPAALAGLLQFLHNNTITPQTAKTVLDEMAATGKAAADIIRDKGLEQISDSSELESLIETILKENPAECERYRGGETKLLAFFIGQVMRGTKGKADQTLTRKILEKKLG
ncbi:MAG: Asp-tRNA(Asn)/Glu-tRNA(Gln) amidotransferase subunit GatB [Candidatus Neomarinimicrobiota bacterium]|jgi:aspartyl-tRNA(Asn)/glutamyl-tRNA(Gln) amidotransferase subunit B|nr:Asp-tRNA(Asn)/Glu-tRNA(Gln) amidotransferase subunit GatB [Candidatus Neomarinimicrobiota bacterium]MDD3965920.1 Asp-tRNA(Asn)/Glu-tRNA(Gln) amidotransferase subunit GatB [Candidatus Neomarinimicrobiota bacterium]MDX9780105.1 Asp-tRNA(Asn)/Glu-tRNA(Gln) amidotransferase subunit GatB [bacterium]